MKGRARSKGLTSSLSPGGGANIRVLKAGHNPHPSLRLAVGSGYK